MFNLLIVIIIIDIFVSFIQSSTRQWFDEIKLKLPNNNFIWSGLIRCSKICLENKEEITY